MKTIITIVFYCVCIFSGDLPTIVQMGSCTSKKLQRFMMKLCQMETTNFLLTKSLEFSIKMQMDILTLRWQVNSLTKQNKFMCANLKLIILFDSSKVLMNVIIQEFLIAIDMALNGSPEEKLRWGFRIFDKDGSGEEWGLVRSRAPGITSTALT